MFIPLHDRNNLKHIRLQVVTIGLILANVVIFFLTGPLFVEASTVNADLLGFGYIPALIFGDATLAPGIAVVPEAATHITYAFLHADLYHLGTNMLFLWVFGDNVEDALGHVRFLIFYLACAAAGALVHGLVVPFSQAPLIGASGAVSGVVAAYFLLHPKVRVWVLVLFRIPLPLPAFIPLALWIAQQFYMLAVDPSADVSWGAHVGGIIAGLLLVLVMRRKGVPLFDRVVVVPKAVRLVDTAPREIPPPPPSTPQGGAGPWGTRP
ncbi:membrane associated rhomboid family serine protease [Rhizobium sp. PP-WC-2G-219]|nr:membrane associated rhomboid family serine protease [Rhizobium sp. PP-WC-2G-219]